MEDVNKRQLNFLPLSELEYVSQEFGLKRVRLRLTKQMSWSNRKEIERTQIHYLSDVFVDVAVVMVHCIVRNSKFTHRDLSNNRFKLLKVTPVQIKPKLFRVIVNSWAWLVSLSICTLVIFSLLDYRGEEALPKSA